MVYKVFFMAAFCIGLTVPGHAQNFYKVQRQQKANIQAAYRKGRLTEKEYYKLMEEQETIRYTIEKYQLDRYLSYDEKNKIAAKQERAANRLRKYQVNRERY